MTRIYKKRKQRRDQSGRGLGLPNRKAFGFLERFDRRDIDKSLGRKALEYRTRTVRERCWKIKNKKVRGLNFLGLLHSYLDIWIELESPTL